MPSENSSERLHRSLRTSVREMAAIVPSPLLGEGMHLASQEFAWVRGLSPRREPLIRRAMRATFSHKARRTEDRRLPRRHADGTVETDGLAVEHGVLDDVHGERAVFLGIAETRGMRHLGP